MLIIYQTGDLVEYRGFYWRVVFCDSVSETVDLRNAAGKSVDNVPLNAILPCASTIKGASYKASN